MLQIFVTICFLPAILSFVHNSNVNNEIVKFCSINGYNFLTFVSHENEKFQITIIKQLHKSNINARILSYEKVKEFHNDQDIIIFDGRTSSTQLSTILSEIRVRKSNNFDLGKRLIR